MFFRLFSNFWSDLVYSICSLFLQIFRLDCAYRIKELDGQHEAPTAKLNYVCELCMWAVCVNCVCELCVWTVYVNCVC